MLVIESWIDTTTSALQSLWEGFILLLPTLFGAIIVFLVGWIIAVGLEKLVIVIINALKLDTLLEKLGFGKMMHKAGSKLESGKFLGFIVKWFIILVFLTAAMDILQLTAVTYFLKSILAYIPNVAAAIFILLITVWLADFLQNLVQVGVSATTEVKSGLLGVVTKWTVLIFGFMAALSQLGIAEMLIQTLITGIIAMLAIAGGLAFGLGGKDHASDFIRKVRQELDK